MDNTGIIAIDGPAASGKSSIALRVAEAMGGVYVCTGDMYRALTWLSLSRGIDPARSPEEVVALLGGIVLSHRVHGPGSTAELLINGVPPPNEALHSPEVSAQVSHVAKIPEVRAWLVQRQREAASLGLIIVEGRDIGTVIFPEARHKFFLTASPEVRARRRLAQGGESPNGATVEAVARQIAERDRIDSTRAVAPLRPAADAITVDSSDMTIAEVVEFISQRVQGI